MQQLKTYGNFAFLFDTVHRIQIESSLTDLWFPQILQSAIKMRLTLLMHFSGIFETQEGTVLESSQLAEFQKPTFFCDYRDDPFAPIVAYNSSPTPLPKRGNLVLLFD